jgi:uncharacterized repeat protein (TIGR01451 family)
MAKLHSVLAVFCLLVSLSVFAQNADQEMLSATDSPDPVIPGATLTYSIAIRNNGPNPAVNGGLNANIDLNITGISASSSTAGFTCFVSGSNLSCTHPAFPSGTTANFTVTGTVAPHLVNFPDGTLTSSFFPSGTSPDPNNGNNSATVSTSFNSPQMDLGLTVTDSPDPVTPNNNITYSIVVTNAGPDNATSVNFNVPMNGFLRYQSHSVPAAFTNCIGVPPVGGSSSFTCQAPTLAPGTYNITVVMRADPAFLGINDGTLTQHFDINGTGDDTNDLNNSETESTAYVTPDADMSITATGSPDPVAPDGDITYTVTVANQGPDAAPNAKMVLGGNGGQTRFQSISFPAGWTCAMPPPGTLINATSYECNHPSLPSGTVAVFTVVVEASADLHPNSDHNVTQVFVTGSNVTDPDHADTSVQVTTQYTVSDADLNITVTDSPDPVTPDGDITYTVTVTNQGPDTATNARMTIAGNGGQTRFQSITAPAGWTCAVPAPGTLINAANYDCTNPSFASGMAAVFTVVTEASDDLHSNNDGTITQVFLTGADQADPDSTDNSELESTAYDVPNADIAVTNADAPDPVSPGDTITYTQTITNNGPEAATNATLSQVLPSSVGFQSITEPSGFTCATPAIGASGTITCTNPSLANGASASFTLIVVVGPAPGSTIGNTVTGGSNASDVDPSDNTATVATNVIIPVVADLGINKSNDTDSASPGGSIAYTITLTNNGPDAASNVVMTDALPSELLFQAIDIPAGFTCTTPPAGTNGTITCNAATLASGTTATFTLIVQLTSGAVGPINNTATASSSTDDDNGGNDSDGGSPVLVNGASTADLSVTKSTPTTTAGPDDTVTYTIVITNGGPNQANDVIVRDVLPASLLFQSIAPAASFACTTPAVGTSGTITCTGGPLADLATATFTLVTTIAPGASGSIANGVTVYTSDTDPTPGNSTTSSGGVLVASADLSISKTTSATQAQTGSTMTYTISVTNSGPDSATNVVVNDNLPTGLQFVSATPSQGSCSGTDPFSCTLGTLASGATATITLQTLVTATSGTISNSASVTSATDDPTAANNSASTPAAPVTPAAAETADIPTLSEWALLAMVAMLGALAMRKS